MSSWFRRAELYEAVIPDPCFENADSCDVSRRFRGPGRRMSDLLAHLVGRFTRHASLRRYQVTPRQNAYAFRRALLRDALRELKQDPVFDASPTWWHTRANLHDG
jgi:hypothetical protein